MSKVNWIVGAALAAAMAAGCAGGGAADAGRAPSATTGDAKGDEPLAGVVRIEDVVRAGDGRVKYTLRNVSEKDQDDLSCRIEFAYDPTGQGAISIAQDREYAERDLVLVRGGKADVVADNPRPGKAVRSTKIEVREDAPVAAVAREAGVPGSLFLNRRLECVAIATDDEVRAGQLWIEVENVSDRPAAGLEARAVFRDMSEGGAKVAETKWANVKTVPAGGRVRIAFDIAGLGPVARYRLLVKVRQQSL